VVAQKEADFQMLVASFWISFFKVVKVVYKLLAANPIAGLRYSCCGVPVGQFQHEMGVVAGRSRHNRSSSSGPTEV